MLPIPNIDCASFYAQRDNRTNIALAQPPFPVKLALTITLSWAETIDGQLALHWMSSLVARMGQRYNQVQFFLPQGVADLQSQIPGLSGISLADALLSHLQSADPCGSYAVVDRLQEGSYVVAVGDSQDKINGVVVRPTGWSAIIAPPGLLPITSLRNDSLNPIGAALAAALGAAEIYRFFNQEGLGGRGAQLPLWISARQSAVARTQEEASLWSQDIPLPNQIDLGRWLVVGAGALGGNVLVILGAIADRLRGRIDIVDHDRIDVSNLNRLIAALIEHVGRYKVELAASCMQRSSIEVVPHTSTYEKLRAASAARILPIEDYNLVLTGVDQMGTRAFVQSDWPRFLIDAGTRNYTWRVSTHSVTTDNACIGCLAGKSQNTYRDLKSPLACAAGLPGQSTQSAPPMDSYSFVSFFGATFMAARALERVLGLTETPSESFSTEAFALNLAGLQHGMEPASDRCLCRCSHPAVHEYRTAKYQGGVG